MLKYMTIFLRQPAISLFILIYFFIVLKKHLKLISVNFVRNAGWLFKKPKNYK